MTPDWKQNNGLLAYKTEVELEKGSGVFNA